MKTKSLANTNPHLKQTAKAKKQLAVNIASSTSVETKQPVAAVINRITKLRAPKPEALHKKSAF